MKIYLFTGFSGFTQRTHNLAKLIKKNKQNTKISCLVSGLHNYEYLIQNKKNIYDEVDNIDRKYREFEKLKPDYSSEDLTYIENITNRPINYFLYSERILVQHTHSLIYDKNLKKDQIYNIFLKLFTFLEHKVKDSDLIFSYTSASLVSEILFYLCKFYKKKYLTLNEVRISRKWSILENNKDFHDEIFNNYINIENFNKEGEKLFNSYCEDLNKDIKNPAEQHYQFNLIKNKKLNFKNISRFVNSMMFENPELRHFLSPKGLNRIKSNIRYFKYKFFSKKFFVNNLPKNKYLYYPLSTIPEASTLIRGVNYYDQLSNIKQMSLNLPLDYSLVVREHPGMIGKTNYKFYEEISRIYNVILLSPEFNNTEAIKHSSAVITVTGTSGIESLFLGKKTIVMGNSIYSDLKTVHKIDNFNQIYRILLLNHSDKEIDNQFHDMKCFCTAISSSDLIDDINTVIWTKKAFEKEYIDFDYQFYNTFSKKYL